MDAIRLLDKSKALNWEDEAKDAKSALPICRTLLADKLRVSKLTRDSKILPPPIDADKTGEITDKHSRFRAHG